MLPCVEDVRHVDIPGVVATAVTHELLDKVCLEVDFLVAILECLVLCNPFLPVRVPGLGVGNVDLAEDVLDAPEAAHVEHRVRVVLVLYTAVEQFVVASLLPDEPLVEAGRVKNILRLQTEVLPEEWI